MIFHSFVAGIKIDSWASYWKPSTRKPYVLPRNMKCLFSDLSSLTPTIKLKFTYLQVSRRLFFLPPLSSEGCMGSTLASSFFGSDFFSSLWWVIDTTPYQFIFLKTMFVFGFNFMFKDTVRLQQVPHFQVLLNCFRQFPVYSVEGFPDPLAVNK